MRRLRCRSCTQRKELLEREADAVGALRRVCVQHVEADFKRSCIEFARVPGEPNWLRVAGLHALLCQAALIETTLEWVTKLAIRAKASRIWDSVGWA
jgi:hypothetical protein